MKNKFYFLAALLTVSCAPTIAQMRIVVNDTTLRVAWSLVTTNVDGEPEIVAKYKIWQNLNNTGWVLVGTNEGARLGDAFVPPDTTYNLPPIAQEGRYIWAVSAVDEAGNESELHVSTDSTAYQGGWFVIYDKTKPTKAVNLRPF